MIHCIDQMLNILGGNSRGQLGLEGGRERIEEKIRVKRHDSKRTLYDIEDTFNIIEDTLLMLLKMPLITCMHISYPGHTSLISQMYKTAAQFHASQNHLASTYQLLEESPSISSPTATWHPPPTPCRCPAWSSSTASPRTPSE